MADGDIFGTVHIVKRLDKHIAIFRDHPHTFGKDRPDSVNPVMKRASDLIFFRVASHFELRGHWENGLRSQYRFQTMRQPFFGRCIEAVVKIIGKRQPSVMEQYGEGLGTKVPQRTCVSRDPLLDSHVTGAGIAGWANTHTPLADAKRQAVGATEPVMVTGTTGNVEIAGQNFVIEQQLSDLGAGR